jgi:hypothetical protein
MWIPQYPVRFERSRETRSGPASEQMDKRFSTSLEANGSSL